MLDWVQNLELELELELTTQNNFSSEKTEEI